MKRAIALLMLLAACGTASAVSFPKPSKMDSRFQSIKYGRDIVKVCAKEGAFLEIYLAPEDTDILYKMGDKEGWTIKTEGNSFSMKPKGKLPDTPLKLWSGRNSKREYYFDIVTTTEACSGRPWALRLDILVDAEPPKPAAPPPPIPPEVLERQRQAQAKLDVENRLGTFNSLPPQEPDTRNTLVARSEPNGNYGIIGPDELTPTSVYDNGEQTAITFAPNNPMPRVFVKEADGSESRVPFHIENDILIVHRVARKFVLRRGAAVACLINGSFNPIGANSNTNTVSDEVVREIKGVQN